MTSTEAIEIISSVLVTKETQAQFTVTEGLQPPGNSPMPLISVKIEASHLGEKCAALMVIHPKRPLDDSGKKYLRETAVRVALNLLDLLEVKLNARESEAAKNN